jgi:hypothetical protein
MLRTALPRAMRWQGAGCRRSSREAAALDLPGWYLVAGCLYQTVWNVATGQPPEAGILDYDLAYFDDSDRSWEAEDTVIQARATRWQQQWPSLTVLPWPHRPAEHRITACAFRRPRSAGGRRAHIGEFRRAGR